MLNGISFANILIFIVLLFAFVNYLGLLFYI